MTPPTTPTATVGSGRGDDLVDDGGCARCPAAAVEHEAQRHRAGADQQRDAQRGLDLRSARSLPVVQM